MLCGVTATLGSNPSATATAARPHWGWAALLCPTGVSRLIGQVVLVFGLSFVATKPKGGGWTRCDLSSWLARSCWFYPGF